MSTDLIMVVKRDGSREPLDIEKIHRVVMWAGEGLAAPASQVELRARLQFKDGMTTEEIHETLIKAAADEICEEYPDFAILAGRMAMFHIRKRAYGRFEPPTLQEHIEHNVEQGRYDSHLVDDYSPEELTILNEYMEHKRDLNFAYSAAKQFEGKYLIQHRVTGHVYESPQMLYMLVGACLFSGYPKETRLDYVKRWYDATSQFKLSLPTPIMAGVRTPTRQFSSCVLIECGDNLDSINATSASIVKYVSQRAGIGINAGRIRALGSPIRNGEAFHTGCIPFYKHFQTAVKSCSQGGVRGGAATLFYPIWHKEVESLLVLKNNRGVEENRVRHLDYGVQINKLMYTRLIQGGDITLFSPDAVPGMYEAYFADQVLFEKLYTEAEKNPLILKETIKAVELFGMLAAERAQTGRVYLQNVDHCNENGPFIPSVAPIRQSNLCLEIALPTKPLTLDEDERIQGEIALCTLAAFNLGEINDHSEFEELADLIVRALDALLDYQDYPLRVAKEASMYRRPLGVGVINFAYWLAKNGLKYSDGSANTKVHELFEAIQFNLLKASNNLAKEKGACPGFKETKYAEGLMPIDRYKDTVNGLHNAELLQNWPSLREDIKEYGLRNSTLTALMPCETSSQITNSTNGIEPPRGYVSVKASKDGILKQVVPDYENLKDQYELLWDIPDNKGYMELVAIMQKFVDQAISANLNYDPKRFDKEKVPVKVLLQDLLMAYKLGLKTLYYHNTRDGASDQPDDECGGACKL
ncbi:class 1a ribonucleoside-diphosphate reductase subunit alpha [Neptuniibacter sp. QD37_11]|uniref:class 1a ribonucleoside-diphosphate reductase subunit alpha n=1 Tax=Neptuniibacter sp. QD37_11 TaxID=3398209 RepID=UPI0039F5BEBF